MNLCKCGCGKETNIFRGKHREYIHGHGGLKKGKSKYNSIPLNLKAYCET